jgi:uncharacterized DUF497 family protein
MEFEWDDDKAAQNLKDHKVSFETATAAFSDRCAIEYFDQREDYGEERVILIGHAFGTLLFVVYTLREERYRLISARRATKNEQNDYYLQNS